MCAQTKCKHCNLSEMQSQKAKKKKRKEDYRTNRLVAENFTKVSKIPLHVWCSVGTPALYSGNPKFCYP